MKKAYSKQAKIFYALLNLKHRLVGIRFFDNKSEYEKCRARNVLYKMPYCVMVKSAVAGHSIKVKEENFGCKAAARALGFVKPKESFLQGEDGFRFGIYKNIETAKESSNRIALCDKKRYGMWIAPLEEFECNPDVVICITEPYNAMRLVQAYTYSYGNANEFKLGGLQAMCSEVTAYPYMTANMNITMLCAGTRNLCKWREEELAVGIPYVKFEGVLKGLLQTVNPLERDEKKKNIENALKSIGEETIVIEYGKNYDDNLYEFGKSGRR